MEVVASPCSFPLGLSLVKSKSTHLAVDGVDR